MRHHESFREDADVGKDGRAGTFIAPHSAPTPVTKFRPIRSLFRSQEFPPTGHRSFHPPGVSTHLVSGYGHFDWKIKIIAKYDLFKLFHPPTGRTKKLRIL